MPPPEKVKKTFSINSRGIYGPPAGNLKASMAPLESLPRHEAGGESEAISNNPNAMGTIQRK